MSSEDARKLLSSLKAMKPSQATIGSGYGVPGGTYAQGMSPLVANYAMPGMPYGERTYGTALPRDPREFLSGMFSPLSPIQPVAIDQPRPGFERPEPRDFEYPVSWNMPIGIPGSEGLKLASFANLRSIADIYSVARACIKLRIQEILGLEWDIIPTKDAEKNMRGDDGKHKDFQKRRAEAMKFWRNPDPTYGSFESWLSAILEDILVIDALSLYLHPSRMRGKGLLGSDVAAVEIIAGETIRPLLDVSGGRPKPPNPAYQQYMYGVPRADLMTVIDHEDLPEGMSESMVAEYRGDQLLYLPYFRRSWTPYGYSPVEQALIPAMMGIQRQSWQLDTYSEGSVPAVFISAGDTNATPNQLRELQDALNAMAGDPAWKHKIIVLPGGSKIDPMKPQALADAFDEIMMTQMCMAFDVMPMELGISPKVSTSQSPGAANQMAKASEKVNQRKALRPMLKWLKASVFDFVMQKVCKQPDMQFMWEGLEEGVDEESQVGLLIQEISFGLRSIDEARIQRGEQPWGLPMTSDPVYATPNGLMPIGSIDPQTGMPAALQPEVAPGSALPGANMPNGALAGTTPSGNPSSARTVKPGKPNRLPTASVPGPKAKPVANTAPSQKPVASGPRVSPAHTSQGSSTKSEKVSKASVNYREGSPARHCGNCSMYRLNPPDFESGACTLVEGIIEETMVCDRWARESGRTAKGIDTKAALKELDLVRRQLKAGRSIAEWQVKDLPQQVIDELRADLPYMDLAEAVTKARDSVYKLAKARAGQGTADREAAIGHVQSRVASELRRLCDGVENGKLSTADFLAGATQVMRTGLRAGLQAGANAAVDQMRAEKRMALRFQGETWRNIVKDDGGESDGYNDVLDSGTPYSDYLDMVAGREAERQSGYLSGLLQDILAAFGMKDWLDNLSSRLDLYAAQVRSAYEQGYGTTYAAMNPDGVIYTWYVTSDKPCKLCLNRDGQQFTEDQLPGFPGQGGFGDATISGAELHLCMGGVNCKCYLSATTVSDGTGGGGFFKAARAAFSASLKSVLGKAHAEEITQHDHGYHSHPDETHHVYAYLARHYPAKVLGWVKSARWSGPVEVKLKDIDMKRRQGGRRNPDKVRAIAHGIEDGHKIDPIVLVKVPGEKKYQIADGWHRTAGIEATGRKSAMAWIGEVDAGSSFSAEEMGAASLNYQRSGLDHNNH
jgi:hypothetical protein